MEVSKLKIVWSVDDDEDHNGMFGDELVAWCYKSTVTEFWIAWALDAKAHATLKRVGSFPTQKEARSAAQAEAVRVLASQGRLANGVTGKAS